MTRNVAQAVHEASGQELIERAVLVLAGRCDGAHSRDGAGFNRLDTRVGHELARKIEAGEDVNLVFAHKVVGKYRGQLERAGIALPPLEVARGLQDARYEKRPDKQPQGVAISLVGKEVAIRFPYNPALVEVARGLHPKRYFDGPSKSWRVPAAALEAAIAAFPGATLAPELAGAIKAKREAAAKEERARAVQLAADTAAYEQIVQELGADGLSLYGHQDVGCRWLIENRKVILADDMGLGKTMQALVAAKAFGHRIIVVAPAGLRINWLREAMRVDAQIEIYSWAKVPEPIPGDFTLIGDESHYCFPAGTMVATERGQVAIDELVNGREYASVASVDTEGVVSFKPVTAWLRFKPYTELVRVTHEGGSFVCTADHRIWTDCGYVEAATLPCGAKLCTLPENLHDSEEGDDHSPLLYDELCDYSADAVEGSAATHIASTSQATRAEDVRMVQADLPYPLQRQGFPPAPVLFERLFERMERDVSSDPCPIERMAFRRTSEHGWQAARRRAAHAAEQSDAGSAYENEDATLQAGANVPFSGRERGVDQATGGSCVRSSAADGVRDQDCPGSRSIPLASNSLQGRHCPSRNPPCHRDRWQDPPDAAVEVSRSPKGGRPGRSRVVRVEVLERGGRPGSAGRPQQNQFVYCLEVEGNHNFFADGVLVSNCQNLKARRSKRFIELAKAAKAVFALSGTPIKNGRPANLYPILLAVGHDLAKDKRAFDLRYCAAKATRWSRWDVTGAAHLDELHDRTADVILRRMKTECLDLPEKVRVTRQAELSGESARLYQETLTQLQDEYKRKRQAGLIGEADALVLLNHLRHASSVGKVDTAIEMAEEIVEQGGQVVLFTAFVDSAERLASALHAGRITGAENAEKRQATIDAFQAGQIRVIVCTLGAGNVGITLTAAQTVILVDRPWTPGDAIQAEDRLHRIGQAGSVLAVWLQAEGSVDMAIDALLEQKHQRIELVLAGKKKALDGINCSMTDLAEAVLG